ncbi:MAG: hypothetical protein KJ626_15965 [Verrucomicrobia bacterium]|nr:hypothetical protein [Verrucomicrobiota bacterium]
MLNSRNRLTIFIAVAATCLSAAFFEVTWRTGGDNAAYFLSARSVVRDHCLNLEYQALPVPDFTPAGYPFLLASLFSVVGESVIAGKILNVIFYILMALCITRWMIREEEEISSSEIAAAVAVGVFPVSLLALTSAYASEMSYLFFTVLVLLIVGDRRRAKLGLMFPAGVLTGLAYLIRTPAVALAGAIGLSLLLGKRWRHLVYFGLGCLCVMVPWAIRQSLAGQAGGYYVTLAGEFSDGANPALIVAQTALSSAWKYFWMIPDVIFYELFSGRALISDAISEAGAAVLKAIFLALVLVGLIQRLRKWEVAEFYVLATFALISGFAFMSDFQGRYLLPMLPFIGLYLVRGIAFIAKGWCGIQKRISEKGVRSAAAFGVVVLLLLLASAAGVQHLRREVSLRGIGPWDPARYRAYETPYYDSFATFVEAAGWIRTNTPPDAVVASRAQQQIRMFSDRKGWRYDAPKREGKDAWSAITNMAAQFVVYVIEDSFPADTGFGKSRVNVLEPLLAAHEGRFDLVYESAAPNTRVWRVDGK